MKEIWEDIPRFEGIYQVSNLGRIKSLPRTARKEYRGDRKVKGKLMLGTKNEDGYLKVHLKNKERGIDKIFAIHKIVAEVFIPDKSTYKSEPEEDRSKVKLQDLQVNHKDTNKLNNEKNNLEWCTNLYNQRHAWENGVHKAHKKMSKKVNQYDLDGKLIQSFESLKKASEITGIDFRNISLVANGKRKQTKGYIWRFANE